MPLFPVSTVIRHAAVGNPTQAAKPAVIFENEARSYADLNQRVNQLGAALYAQGMRAGDRVAFLMHNRIEYLEAFFAVTDLGAVFVPINYLLTPAEISYQLEYANCTWMIVSAELQPQALAAIGDKDINQIVLDQTDDSSGLNFEELVAAGEGQELPPPPRRGALAQIQFTSGTTGRPKAVMHSHETIYWNAFHQLHDLDVNTDDVYLCVPALCWSAGMHGFTLATLWSGGTVVLHPSRGLRGDEIVAALRDHAATKVVLVPATMQLVLDELDRTHEKLPDLLLIASGSSPVSEKMLAHAGELIPNAAILQAYGASEFPTIASILTPDKAVEKMGSAGRATSVTSIKIVDSEGSELPAGEHGEIVLQSLALTLGYLDAAELTQEAFRDGWYHSGDRGYMDEDGYLYISGRIKDMVITGGLNVYPAEVEQHLAAHPQVQQVALVGAPDEKLGEVLVAVIMRKPGADVTGEQLAEFLSDKVAKFKRPRRWWILDEPLPSTSTGKLHKPSIRDQVREAMAEGEITS